MKNPAQPIALSAMIALAMVAPITFAAKPAHTGTYKVVASDICQSNDVGFSAYPILQALGTNYQVINSWESTMRFLADGTVTEVTRGQYALPSATQQPVGTFEHVCSYTSTQNTDGSFTLIGACDGNVLSGIALNERTHISPVVWRVTPAAGMILLSQVGTQVLTLTTDPPGTHYRICQGTGIGVK
jgi:hypothetical protein